MHKLDQGKIDMLPSFLLWSITSKCDANTNLTDWRGERYTVFSYCSAAKFAQNNLTFYNILKRRLVTDTFSFTITQIKSRNKRDK